jgi:hypothetical protein
MKRDYPNVPNSGVVYSYIETSNGFPKLDEFPKQKRYVSSTNNYQKRKSSHDNENVVNVERVSFVFYKHSNFIFLHVLVRGLYEHLRHAITSEKRTFVRIPIITEIQEEHRQLFEDAIKRVMGKSFQSHIFNIC